MSPHRALSAALPAAALAFAALAFAACAEAPTADVYTNDDLLADIAGYESWASPVGWDGLQISCDGSHGAYVRLYANAIAMADLEAGAERLSRGAALVNASFQDPVGTPKLITAVRKVADFAPDGGNLYWGQLDEHGTLLVGGAVPACERCHSESAGHLKHRDEVPPERVAECPDDDTGAIPVEDW